MLSSQMRNWPGNFSWTGASVVFLIAVPTLSTRGNIIAGGLILPDSGKVQPITKGKHAGGCHSRNITLSID